MKAHAYGMIATLPCSCFAHPVDFSGVDIGFWEVSEMIALQQGLSTWYFNNTSGILYDIQ